MSLLTVEPLTKRYADIKAVNNVQVTLQQNSCIALLGPNGAGKTTLMKMMAGLIYPTKGKISFSNIPPHSDIWKYIGLPQQPVFYDWMTAREFLEYVGELSNLPRSEVAERSGELLKVVGISEVQHQRNNNFPGG